MSSDPQPTPPKVGGVGAAAARGSLLFEYFREVQFGAPTVFGVRTATAKLIRYPGRDDWTELVRFAGRSLRVEKPRR